MDDNYPEASYSGTCAAHVQNLDWNIEFIGTLSRNLIYIIHFIYTPGSLAAKLGMSTRLVQSFELIKQSSTVGNNRLQQSLHHPRVYHTRTLALLSNLGFGLPNLMPVSFYLEHDKKTMPSNNNPEIWEPMSTESLRDVERLATSIEDT